MKIVNPIYEGLKCNVQVLNDLLESKGLKTLPLDIEIKVHVFDDDGKSIIELSFVEDEMIHHTIVVHQDCDEYHYLDWKLFEL